jgi:predicted dehydrogenase
MKRFRAVVIGAGAIAGNHLNTLKTNGRTELVAVADIDRERANEAAERYAIKPYTDYRGMVREERPDIVVITLPHYLHKEAAIWCAEQRCHVLLEKPMAMNARECADINEAASRAGIVLAVGHMQHYFAENIKAKQLIASGQLGRLVMINDRRYGYYYGDKRPAWFLDKAASGGGIAMNIGSHSIDKIQWLTDSRIVKVKAELTHFGERGNVEGSASLLMRTSKGVTASVSLFGYRGVPTNETELLFTGGALKIVARKGLWISGANGYEPVETGTLTEPFGPQWEELLNAIEHGADTSMSGEYGLTVAAALDAVYRSHETGMEQEVSETSGSYVHMDATE